MSHQPKMHDNRKFRSEKPRLRSVWPTPKRSIYVVVASFQSNHFQMTIWKIRFWFRFRLKSSCPCDILQTGKWNMTEGCTMPMICLPFVKHNKHCECCIVENFKWICSQINFTFPVHNMFSLYTWTRICNRRRWIVWPPAVWISIEIIRWLVSVCVRVFFDCK